MQVAEGCALTFNHHIINCGIICFWKLGNAVPFLQQKKEATTTVLDKETILSPENTAMTKKPTSSDSWAQSQALVLVS